LGAVFAGLLELMLRDYAYPAKTLSQR
jgi:hypothetical protein